MPTCVFFSMEINSYPVCLLRMFNPDKGAYGDMLFQGTECLLQYMAPVHFSLLYTGNIAGLIIILSKYSSRVSKLMRNNYVAVLATLFLLSYAKLLRIIISALCNTILYTSEGRKVVWSADGNVDYLSPSI